MIAFPPAVVWIPAAAPLGATCPSSSSVVVVGRGGGGFGVMGFLDEVARGFHYAVCLHAVYDASPLPTPTPSPENKKE